MRGEGVLQQGRCRCSYVCSATAAQQPLQAQQRSAAARPPPLHALAVCSAVGDGCTASPFKTCRLALSPLPFLSMKNSCAGGRAGLRACACVAAREAASRPSQSTRAFAAYQSINTEAAWRRRCKQPARGRPHRPAGRTRLQRNAKQAYERDGGNACLGDAWRGGGGGVARCVPFALPSLAQSWGKREPKGGLGEAAAPAHKA